ncbi:hypothetical protein H4Q32_024439 [Labeo rohita]|nr:hypothetical protein H4Q32_024439 [Labeo rohita]
MFCQSIQSDFKLINQLYTFPGNASVCLHAEWRKKHPTDATIATYKNRMCAAEKGFEEEFGCEDNHLLLKSANYNDQGRYEFICDGVQTQINLDVLYAENKSVVETDNITLKCYAVNAKDVTWMHDNERVLHFKTDGSINPGKGYEGRASLAKDCFKTGDLSLTIAGVRIEDAGIYRCFVDDETVKGNPHACVLLVNEKRSSPGDQTDCSCNEAILITLTVVFGLISVISVTCLITIILLCTTTGHNTTGNDHMPMTAISTTQPPNESQPLVPYSVQESDLGNKTSNTMPIF